MKLLVSFLFSIQLLVPALAIGQGGWDIGYVSIDSVTTHDIGRDIKIDFRAESDTTTNIPGFLMGFIGKADTIKISIGTEVVQLIERRNIYDDWGFYDEQFLECPEYGTNQLLRVYHSVIEDVKIDSLKVRLYMEVYPKYRRGKIGLTPRRFSESLWISKKKLNGIMFKL